MELLSLILISLLIAIILILVIAMYTNGPRTYLAHSMKGKKIVITGGSRGIGLVCAKELIKQGATVIVACRNKEQADSGKKTIENEEERKRFIFKHLDLSSFQSIKTFADDLKDNEGNIDILINNAGSCFLDFALVDGIEQTYYTNHLGHLLLSILLLDHINPKGLIINVSTRKYARISESVLNDFTADSNLEFKYNEKGYNWMKTYVLTKLACVHAAQILSDYIQKFNLDIKAVSLHPGFINNRFFREIEDKDWFWWTRDTLQRPFRLFLFKDNEMGAQTTLHLCYMKFEDIINGAYYKDCHIAYLQKIGQLENAKKTKIFDKKLIEKNNLTNNDPLIKSFFEN